MGEEPKPLLEEGERFHHLPTLITTRLHEAPIVTWPNSQPTADDPRPHLFGILLEDGDACLVAQITFSREHGVHLAGRSLSSGQIRWTGEKGPDALYREGIMRPCLASTVLHDAVLKAEAASRVTGSRQVIDALSPALLEECGQAFDLVTAFCLTHDPRPEDAATPTLDEAFERRRWRFYDHMLPEMLRVGSLDKIAELLQLTKTLEQLDRLPCAHLVFQHFYWPLLTLPQAGRAFYGNLVDEEEEEHDPERVRKLERRIDRLLDLLAPGTDELLPLLKRVPSLVGDGDGCLADWLDPDAWGTEVWYGLRPYAARINRATLDRLLTEHWKGGCLDSLVTLLLDAAPFAGHRQAICDRILENEDTHPLGPIEDERVDFELARNLPELEQASQTSEST